MSRHLTREQRAVRSDGTGKKNLRLATCLLVMLAVVGCSGPLAPAAGRVEPSTTSNATSLPAARTSTPASFPVTPTVQKPTATFVPLPTPSPTAEGLPTRIAVPRISVEVARQMAITGEAILVDVRTRATFERTHITGAISLPSDEILDRVQELPTDQLIVFYCA